MVNHSSHADDQLIASCIGPQLCSAQNRKIDYIGAPLTIDFCSIRTTNPRPTRKPVVLVTGFGSGWAGIAELGFYLARDGWRVTMVSLPGYGNSENPPKTYWQGSYGFYSEVLVLHRLTHAMRKTWAEPPHWVGHSLGAAVITELACHFTNSVSSITLLNPAGFERQNPLWLATKFTVSGLLHRLTFRGETAWPRLKPFLPKERSPFTRGRLAQRMSEWRRIAGDSALQFLAEIPDRIPIAYITGERDFVFPWRRSAILNDGLLVEKNGVAQILPLSHNTTMLGSSLTARAITDFLKCI